MKIIELKNISKVFNVKSEEIKALDCVNMEITQGEVVTVMGPSGAGKSTLLHLIGLMDKPSTGELYIDGEPISSLTEPELSALRNGFVGFVFQFHHLLPEFDAIENIAIPALIKGRPKKETYEKAMQLLKEVNLENRKNHFPSQLSGGEQQRVSIARCLINDPKLVLADEPTGNLDHESGTAVMDLMNRFVKEKNISLILVTHNPALEKYSNRTIRLSEGKITP
ncbi:MAG: ABC transporter ATP-binding protein [Elusimicrobia bacterium RIFOXYA2_FULL_39_19]|nr:MAG: ABC transporter ATP-binding protein [Elusimicrobia bacterium RIFOXYA2_FULL_39_19]